jgi:lipopolysaccharide export LptBFGC system permease protein LptF
MIVTLVIALVVAALILWATIWVTNKAYAKKWENSDDEH